jgi:hypothetical protein
MHYKNSEEILLYKTYLGPPSIRVYHVRLLICEIMTPLFNLSHPFLLLLKTYSAPQREHNKQSLKYVHMHECI